jgi:hypothetical protein
MGKDIVRADKVASNTTVRKRHSMGKKGEEVKRDRKNDSLAYSDN